MSIIHFGNTQATVVETAKQVSPLYNVLYPFDYSKFKYYDGDDVDDEELVMGISTTSCDNKKNTSDKILLNKLLSDVRHISCGNKFTLLHMTDNRRLILIQCNKDGELLTELTIPKLIVTPNGSTIIADIHLGVGASDEDSAIEYVIEEQSSLDYSHSCGCHVVFSVKNEFIRRRRIRETGVIVPSERDIVLRTDYHMFTFGTRYSDNSWVSNNVLCGTRESPVNILPSTFVEDGIYHGDSNLVCGYSYDFIFGRNHLYLCSVNSYANVEAVPLNVKRLKSSRIAHIVSGKDFAILVIIENQSKSNLIYSFGRNRFGECGLGHFDHCGMITRSTFFDENIDVKQICAGISHAALLDRKTGSVWVTGSNKYGQLGLGTKYDKVSVFTQIDSIHFQNQRITQIACGSHHTIFVANYRELWATGDNRYNQCYAMGNSPRKIYVPIPISLPYLFNTKIVKVTCGNRHTVLVLDKLPQMSIFRNAKSAGHVASSFSDITVITQ